MFKLSPEAITWAYRLFLDRDPESPLVVEEKLKMLISTQDVRQEFLNSYEFNSINDDLRSPLLSGNEPPMHIEGVSDLQLQELFFHIQNIWENFGETEPYWSVATSEQFRSSNINDTRSKFYETGLNNVTTLFNTLERNGIDHSHFKTCLEYGCGLGRVTCWLAKRFETVLGYDISGSHLRFTKQYFDEVGIQNVLLHHISKPQDIGNFPKVDVIYSVIVLQHNPPPIIRLIIQELIRALNPGGIAYFQVPTYRLGYNFSMDDYLEGEAARGDMEMHVFPQKEIFDIIAKEHAKVVEILEDRWTGLKNGENRSNTFVVQKE
ncbi:MAG: class I SAM-dependent methyltransferase [Methylococcales bacterium]|nr:class I SAM-dependent methyltransferase [Methylococcales bacterium]